MGLSNDLSCEAGSLSCCPPRGVFNQRSEALFPRAGALGCAVCFTPCCLSGLSVRECGAAGSASAPFVPHSASFGPTTATQVLSATVPISAPPTGLDECLFFISLVSDLLAVRFSVSSGCARRRSVSTYAAILVLHISLFLWRCTFGLPPRLGSAHISSRSCFEFFWMYT